MKLCRFELTQDPGVSRSGIFFDNRVYETDGENAIGVHDLGKVAFLTPIGRTGSVRRFELSGDALYSLYGNPGTVLASQTEVDVPPDALSLEPEVRIGALVRDEGDRIARDEAGSFVLGLAPTISLVSLDLAAHEKATGLPASASIDFPLAVGPLLTTPDELEGKRVQPEDARYRLEVSLSVNGEEVSKTTWTMPIAIEDLVVAASRNVRIAPGDMLLTPPAPLPALPTTRFGRALRPSDTVLASIEELGAVVLRLV